MEGGRGGGREGGKEGGKSTLQEEVAQFGTADYWTVPEAGDGEEGEEEEEKAGEKGGGVDRVRRGGFVGAAAEGLEGEGGREGGREG